MPTKSGLCSIGEMISSAISFFGRPMGPLRSIRGRAELRAWRIDDEVPAVWSGNSRRRLELSVMPNQHLLGEGALRRARANSCTARNQCRRVDAGVPNQD